MYCRYCGARLEGEVKYCPYCGRHIAENIPAAGESGRGEAAPVSEKHIRYAEIGAYGAGNGAESFTKEPAFAGGSGASVKKRTNIFGAWGLALSLCTLLPVIAALGMMLVMEFTAAAAPANEGAAWLIFIALIVGGMSTMLGVIFSVGFAGVGIFLSLIGLIRSRRYRANGLAVAGLAIGVFAVVCALILCCWV